MAFWRPNEGPPPERAADWRAAGCTGGMGGERGVEEGRRAPCGAAMWWALARLLLTLPLRSEGGTYGVKTGTEKERWAALLVALECREEGPYTSAMSIGRGEGGGRR